MTTRNKKPFFHHALRINKNKCIGCTHCMRTCPTDAIRIRNGKASVNPDKCVDCGMCMISCKHNAIIVEQDDFQRIFDYKCRVALVPSVLMGQFDENSGTKSIFEGLKSVGFTHVYEVSRASALIEEAQDEYEQRSDVEFPLISSFCPAVIRLIQVRFPSLLKHITLIKPPLDIAAAHCRHELEKTGIEPSDIGIFYVSPCAAKIVAIKHPVGEKKSAVSGVINMDLIYNKIYSFVSNDKADSGKLCRPADNTHVTWELTGGECIRRDNHAMAVDGIHNVIEILDKLENGELDENITFLELRACDESCAGGILVPGNRFLTVRNLIQREILPPCRKTADKNDAACQNCRLFGKCGSEYLTEAFKLEKLQPRSMLSLDDDMEIALEKMEHVDTIMQVLPNIDCGMCGSPSCQSLAEDIARGVAELDQCVFLRITATKDAEDVKTLKESVRNVWGRINNNE